jgi:flagellar hook-length control protein FliK
MPAANAAVAAGPLAQPPARPQSPGEPGLPAPGQATERQSFANTLRAQLQQAEQPVDAQPVVTEPGAVKLQRGIIAARASPDIPALGALGTAPELTELSSTVDSPPGKTLPPVGNGLPNLELEAAAPRSALPPPLADNSPYGEIIVPAAPPAPVPAAPVAVNPADLVTTETRPANALWNAPTGTTSGNLSASAAQPDQTAPMSNSAGGQSADTDSSSHHQSYRTMESMLVNKTSSNDLTTSTSPKFVMSSDFAMTQAANTMSSAPALGAATALTDLPQMQSMRSLQPTADPELFSSSLSNRLMMMSQDGVQSARLKLHPENLGPLDVRIQVEEDGARVWFAAQHGQTREALEAAIPRLRELFADQGLQLVRADVTSGEGRQQTGDGSAHGADLDSATSNEDPADLANAFIPSLGRISDRLLDVYV